MDSRRRDGVQVTQTSVLSLMVDDERMQNVAMETRWPPDFRGIMGFGLPPFSNASLVLRVRCPERETGCKFKVTAVTSC